jgi:hypothetical protein
MRLHPAVTKEEALKFLQDRTAEVWGEDKVAELEKALIALAEAMAVISTAEIPETTEPFAP